MTYKKELKKLAEKNSDFYSADYVKRVYNTHAKSYNEKTSKREAYEDIKYVSDELEEDMKGIKSSLGNYGIDPFDLPILEQGVNKGEISVEEVGENIDRYFSSNGLSTDDLKPIAKLSRIYLEHDANWGAIHFLMKEITDNGFPDKVPLWDDISEDKKEILNNRGNPNFKDNKLTMPEGFYSDAERLIENNPNWTQEAIAEELANVHFDEDYSKTTTIKRRIRKKGLWK